MLLVAIAWIYVVLMVAVVEATGSRGSLLGAVSTFVLYGVLPLSILAYLYFSPARRRARRLAEALSAEAAGLDPDRGGHAPGDAVAPERKEP
ncbi:MAG: hypothetical protein KGI87_03585 [Burkholderiales bacterium]|nr:hypothetical protein [Burkholderiales bacterium]MDE2296987.1 hypothetical protein [Burkholderiales bacterium]